MFLHIGGNTVVRSKDIIALIEKDIVGDNVSFFKNNEIDQKLVEISDEETKTFVVTEDKIYCSPISSFTLRRRTESSHE